MLPILGVYTSSSAARFPKMMTFKFDVTDLNGENAIQLLQPNVLDYDPTIPCTDCQVFVNGVEMLDLVNDRHPIEFTKLGVNYVTVHFDEMTSISCAGDDLVALDDIDVNAKLRHFAFFIEPNADEDYPGYFSPRLNSVPPAIPKITSAIRMFKDAKVFNDPNIIQWDMSTVEVITDMFFGTEEFNQPISTWDTSALVNIAFVFAYTKAFNQPLTGWDVSNVKWMNGAFTRAEVFNNDISNWDVSSVTNMDNMFDGANKFNQDLSGWCVRLISSNPNGFDDSTPVWTEPKPDWGTCPVNLDGTIVLEVDPSLGTTFKYQRDTTATTGLEHAQIIFYNSDFTDIGGREVLASGVTSVVMPSNCKFIGITDYIATPTVLGISGPAILSVEKWIAQANVIGIRMRTGNSDNCPNLERVPNYIPGSWTTLNYMFQNATKFNGEIGNWDTSRITDMTSMFTRAPAFNCDIGRWNLVGVTGTAAMFDGAVAFNRDIGNWNVSSVTTTSNMFKGAIAFNQDISRWDVSKVVQMRSMFEGAVTFDQPIGSWDVATTANMATMFKGATAFNQDLSEWDVSSVTNMTSMFENAIHFNRDLSLWCVRNIATAPTKFSEGATAWALPKPVWGTCPPRGVLVLGVDPSLGSELTIIGVKLQPEVTALDTNGNIVHQQTITTTSDGAKVTIPATATQVVINPTVQLLPAPVSIGAVSPMIKTINSWKSHVSVDHMTFYWISTGCRNLVSVPQSLPTNIKRMDSMFADARVLNQSLDSWDVSRVVSMGSLFRNAYQFNQPLNSWDVSNVTNMSSMFSGSNFNQPLNNWNVSRVTNMGTMFNGTPFNQDIVGWDTSNVTNMSDMFRSNTSFTKPLLGFNTSKVTNMSNMFDGTYYNQDISDWDTSAVTNMSYMFRNNRQFNQNISGWDTSNVSNMSYMFDGALSFDQPIGNWITTSVTNMTYMFRGTEFNQNISGWDTSKVTNFNSMFLGTSLFDQPIGGWNVSSATNMTGMFNNARNFNQDLSNWCVVKISTEPGTFATGATAWVLPKPVWGTCPGE